jgi:hypothetical protein
MPNTYITHSSTDMDRFNKEYQPDKLYILKKNIQRQQGLKIMNRMDEIMEQKDSYVVIQELLQDPYTINGRKINMRFYVLVICNQNMIDVYVYNDGFMYYTKDLFKPGSKEFGPNITTGYVEREVYQQNPLTHQDFRKYLDQSDQSNQSNQSRELNPHEKMIVNQGMRISDVVMNRIYNLLREVFTSSIGHICTGEKLKQAITFQLFGADIAVNDNLWPMIMEINKGPDMGAKDERDGLVKKTCTKDMLRLLGMINESGLEQRLEQRLEQQPNGFIKIVDLENNKLNPSCI